jgi:hypothetical protein
VLEINMTRQDDGKTSLVEFLRSIKFPHHAKPVEEHECPTHFAHFNQRAGVTRESPEDQQLVRSAN